MFHLLVEMKFLGLKIGDGGLVLLHPTLPVLEYNEADIFSTEDN